jgi:phage-related protein
MAGPIRISILANASQANRALQDTSTRASRVGTSFKKMALPAAAALAVIGKIGADALKSVARIEKINAQTTSVIKSTGGAAGVTTKHVEALAGSLEGLTATEAEATQEGANLLLTFTNIKNGVGKSNQIFDQATTTLVDMARAMGTEPQAAAIQLGKALNDPIKGITALSRVGVAFTDQQKKQITSLTKGGKTMEAQKIILAELNKEFGGSGKAFAKTTEGQIELMKHQFGTLTEELVVGLLPTLKSLATTGTKAMAWATENKGTVKALVVVIASLAATVLVVNAAMKVYTAGLIIFKAVQTGITAATKAWTIAQTALNVVMSLNPIGLVVIAIVALVAIFVVAWKKSDTFRRIVTKGWEAIKAAGAAAFDAVRKKIVTVFNFLKNLFLNFTGPGLIIKHWTKIRTATRAAFDAVRNKVREILGTIKTLFLNFTGPGLIIKHWTTIRTRTREIFEGIRTTVRDKINAVLDIVRGIKNRVTNVFSGATTWLYNAGRDVIDGLIDGIVSMFDSVKNTLGDLTGKLSGWKGPASRDRMLLHRPGQLIIDGLIRGLDSRVPQVKKSLQKITSDISRFDGALVAEPLRIEHGAIGGRRARPEPTVVEIRSSGSKVDDLLVELLRGAIRTRGGNVQLVLGRS